jgi:5-(carboxyamino)imidazole ribonucleotide synthase
MAPRVHNSGHWTIEGSQCSQFENHLRAVHEMPLGSTAMALGGHATMINLIGELPAREHVLALPGVHLHDYGKSPRKNRKLGHATVVGAERAEVDAVAARILG